MRFNLIIKRYNNHRALFRVDAGDVPIANDGNIDIRDILWCVPSIDPSNENRIIVPKQLNKNINIGISYYEINTFQKNCTF